MQRDPRIGRAIPVTFQPPPCPRGLHRQASPPGLPKEDGHGQCSWAFGLVNPSLPQRANPGVHPPQMQVWRPRQGPVTPWSAGEVGLDGGFSGPFGCLREGTFRWEESRSGQWAPGVRPPTSARPSGLQAFPGQPNATGGPSPLPPASRPPSRSLRTALTGWAAGRRPWVSPTVGLISRY